jgi:hypothetical protein
MLKLGHRHTEGSKKDQNGGLTPHGDGGIKLWKIMQEEIQGVQMSQKRQKSEALPPMGTGGLRFGKIMQEEKKGWESKWL